VCTIEQFFYMAPIHRFPYALRKNKCVCLSAKPHMPFGSLEKWQPLKASLSGPKRWWKEADHDYTDDASTPQSSVAEGFQWCRWQCVDRHYHGTLWHLLTTVLGIWFQQLVSTPTKAFHYNGHCLLLFPPLGTVPKLDLVHPKKVLISLFMQIVVFWTSFWLALSNVSTPYYGVCFLESNSGPTSCPQ
jgi:hypothetical protein